MKKLMYLTTIVVITMSLISCSNNQNELKDYKVRLEDLEHQIQKNSEIIEDMRDANQRIILLEEDVELLKRANDDFLRPENLLDVEERVENIQNDIWFISRMLFGDALFSRDDIEIGDFVADMQLIERSEEIGVQFLFSGEKQLTGRYKIVEDDYFHGDMVAFYIDEKVTDILPREMYDLRTIWFSFSNYEEALELLRPHGLSGKVTITIDQYLVDLLESEVINEARLTNVIFE